MITTLAPRRGARRSVRLAATGVVALVTLTGCLQADMGVTLNDDESGEFRIRTLINREKFAEIEEMFGGLGGESVPAADPCAELLEDDLSTDDLPDGAVVEPINDGDWCGATATVPFADLAEFNELAAEFNENSEDGEGAPTGAMSLVNTGDGYRFEVSGVAMSDESMTGGSEGTEGMDEMLSMFEDLLGDMRISYDVRLPGAPLDHNADAVEGNRFQWTLEWGDTRDQLFAETGPGEPDGSADTGDIDEGAGAASGGDSTGTPGSDDDDGSSLTWLWILLGVAAVAVIGFVVYKATRKKGPGPDAMTPPAPPAPGYPAAPDYPPAPAPATPPAPTTPPPPPPPSTGWQPPSE